jgi:hypothetical protein
MPNTAAANVIIRTSGGRRIHVVEIRIQTSALMATYVRSSRDIVQAPLILMAGAITF